MMGLLHQSDFGLSHPCDLSAIYATEVARPRSSSVAIIHPPEVRHLTTPLTSPGTISQFISNPSPRSHTCPSYEQGGAFIVIGTPVGQRDSRSRSWPAEKFAQLSARVHCRAPWPARHLENHAPLIRAHSNKRDALVVRAHLKPLPYPLKGKGRCRVGTNKPTLFDHQQVKTEHGPGNLGPVRMINLHNLRRNGPRPSHRDRGLLPSRRINTVPPRRQWRRGWECCLASPPRHLHEDQRASVAARRV